MAKQLTEDESNLRRKARRRLIGAIALTLAVVVILPMVLDREPGLPGKNINLSIPSPDKVGEFVPGKAVSETTTAQSPAASAVVATPVPAETNHPAAAPQHEIKAPAHKEAVKSAPATAAQQSGEAYVAQVGAFANAAAAKQELNKLKSWGFKAYTERSGDKIRVRVGPYPDRDKAEKVGKLLEKHGMHPVILSAK